MTSAPPSDLSTASAPAAELAPADRGRALRAVLPPFLAARVVTLLAFALAVFLHARLGRPGAPGQLESLLGWDADWYRRIALHGYAHLPHESLRFFPAFPLLARLLAPLVGGVAAALLLLSNGFALLYGYLLFRLVIREGLGVGVARRAVWAAAFTPAAFVLVMGYTESLSGCLLVGLILLVRQRRWLLAALPGAALGAVRPTGVLVAVLVAVEASRGLRSASVGEVGRRLLALAAPAAGTACYLAWVGLRFGDALAPFHVQVQAQLRGGVLLDPRPALRAALSSPSLAGLHPETVHLVWVLVSVGLLAVCAARLPASFTAYAGVVLVLGVTARSFTSFERYSGAAVPLLIAAAVVVRGRLLPAAVLAAAAAVLAGYALLAALHLYIP